MTSEEYLERDPVFQQRMAERAKEVAQAIYGNMMPILKGTAKIRVAVKRKVGTETITTIEEIEPSPDERVRAGKLLKETFIDKKLADKRDSGHQKGKGEGTSHEAALKAAEAKILKLKDKFSEKKGIETAPREAMRGFTGGGKGEPFGNC